MRLVSEDYKTAAAGGGEDRTRDAKNLTALPTALNQAHCTVIMLRYLNTIVIVEYYSWNIYSLGEIGRRRMRSLLTMNLPTSR